MALLLAPFQFEFVDDGGKLVGKRGNGYRENSDGRLRKRISDIACLQTRTTSQEEQAETETS